MSSPIDSRLANRAPPRARQPRWPARLDTLRIKLFLAVAGANAVLAIAAFLVFTWSFDQGFVEYLNRADEARLQPLVQRLAEGHAREGHWNWVADDRRQWLDLLREVLGTRFGRRPEEFASAPSWPHGPPPPPPDPLLTIDPRLMLFDADGTLRIGRAEMVSEALRKPVWVNGQVVGYLGYVPRLKTVASLERLFAAQQSRKFAAIAAGMLAAGLLASAFVAWWLARRIRHVARGAHALIQGDYAMRLEAAGQDELDQLAQDFNQLAATLESAQRARQQWIGDIAHELRTPLAVLRAEIEALQDGVRTLGPASLGSLAQEVARLSRLVDDLRVLSLSDLGALTYHKVPLALDEVLGDCIAAHRGALHDKGFSVEVDLAEGCELSGDATRLSQVFANLMQNTLRYTDAPARLRVRLRQQGERLCLDWEDSAPGVPEAELPRLTERLYRVEGSRSRAGGGSGLGLAIAHAIVLAHGGEMQASPSALGGLDWQIRFPALPAGARRA